MLKHALTISIILLLFGCSQHNETSPLVREKITHVSTPVRQLQVADLLGTGQVSSLAQGPITNKTGDVTIYWNNVPSSNAPLYRTVIWMSHDLSNWTAVITLPYTTNGTVRLTNLPSPQFFKASNQW